MTSYHVHTRWSDGVAAIGEVVAAAASLGLDEVGISDHYVRYPTGVQLEWSMPTDRLREYVEEVRQAAQAAADVTLRLGLEVDYLPETIAETLDAIGGIGFDYLIGSVHFIDGFPVDGHRRYWDALTQDEVDETWRAYYRRLADMAATGAFDIVGHFDLPKKFGHGPRADLREEAMAAMDAVAASGMVMEINTSGWHQPAREVYPAPWIIGEARRRGVEVVITADAHTPKYLTRDFGPAAEEAIQAGYQTVVRFERRRRSAVPLV